MLYNVDTDNAEYPLKTYYMKKITEIWAGCVGFEVLTAMVIKVLSSGI
jgi:hypothetical protein